jgi:glycosyltransferase involved in cell wall biosynthesis
MCLRAQLDTPVVVSVHGIVREEVKHASSLLLRARLQLAAVPIEKYCIRHADHLIAPNGYAERYFGDEIRGAFLELPNAVPDRYFEVEPAPEPGRILFSGTLLPLKHIDDLVGALPDVVARVPEARLHIAGDGRDADYVAGLQRRVETLGVGNRVTFLGQISAEAMLDEYARASVLVLPSAHEASPMVIAEAMASGLPIVATRVGGVPYLVDDGASGYLVELEDSTALSARIAELLDDPRRARQLGAVGRARASERFRGKAVARRARAVYEAAAAIDVSRGLD